METDGFGATNPHKYNLGRCNRWILTCESARNSMQRKNSFGGSSRRCVEAIVDCRTGDWENHWGGRDELNRDRQAKEMRGTRVS